MEKLFLNFTRLDHNFTHQSTHKLWMGIINFDLRTKNNRINN